MDAIMIFISGAGGGALVAWLIAAIRKSAQLSAVQFQSATQAARAEGLNAQLLKLESTLASEHEKNERLSIALAAAQSEKSHLLERIESEARRLSDMQAQMKLEFENLASRLLEEKSAKFLDQNQQHLTALLNPLRERLLEFRERMESIHGEEEKSTAALASQLKYLHELNRQMAEEAINLTNALKGQSKAQGTWGELVLEKILEKCGLTKGVEYRTQTSLRDEEGSRRIPDVIIHLPGDKNIIIDAKVSLTAYERCINMDQESERIAALREHVVSLRRHVDELSRKDYPALQDLQSPDFVLMFVPVEAALHLALQHDPALYGEAFQKGVILVSSSTLLVALRAAESVWRHHKQAMNAQEIARQAGNLYNAFVNFLEGFQEIGARLDQARNAYEQSHARLANGRGNLVKRMLELKKLGVRGEKQIPSELERLAEEPDN